MESREIPPPEYNTALSLTVLKDHDYAVAPDPAILDAVREENAALREEVRQLREQVERQTVMQRFGVHRFSASDEDIRFYTR